MKLAKKLLCVMIVTVMALGMIPFASANVDFTDADEITYTEAVSLLNALGIITGLDDGSFDPHGTFTRAHAATFVARVLRTPAGAENLPVSKDIFSDCIDHWANKYIAFCYFEGIINGYGDGTFGPDDEMTAAMFAVIWMRVLGITPDRWTGDNWEWHAVVDGQDNKILTTNVNHLDPATREEAALYAFNALIHNESAKSTTKTEIRYFVQGTMEGPATPSSLKPEQLAPSGYPLNFLGQTLTMAQVRDREANNILGKNYTLTPVTVEVTEYAGSIAQDKYNVSKVSGASDVYGRLSTVWQNTKTEDILVVLESDPLGYYENQSVTSKKIFDDIGLTQNRTAAVFVDGYFDENDDLFKIEYNNTTASVGGLGTIVEVYLVSPNVYRIVIINTYIGVVSEKVAATTINPTFIEVSKGNNGAGIDNLGPVLSEKGKFVTDSFVKNDIVLYKAAWNGTDAYDVQTVELADSVKVVPTGFNATTGLFTVDGKGHTYSVKASTSRVSSADVTNKKEVELFFDTFDNVILVKGVAAAATRYAVVLNKREVPGNSTGWTDDSTADYEARLLLTDGTTIEVKVHNDDYSKFNIHDIVTYTVGTSYRITVAGKVQNEGRPVNQNPVDIARNRLDNNKAGSVGPTFRADANTWFFIQTAGGSYRIFRGIATVPTTQAPSSNTVYSANVKRLDGDGNATGTADVVAVRGVAAPTDPGTAASKIVYIAANSKPAFPSIDDPDPDKKGAYFTYNAVVNGALDKVQISEDDYIDLLDGKDQLFFGVTESKGLIVKGGTEPDGTVVYTAKGTSPGNNLGIIKFDSGDGAGEYAYTSDTMAFEISSAGVITKLTGAAAVKTGANNTVMFYTVDGFLTAIFYTIVA